MSLHQYMNKDIIIKLPISLKHRHQANDKLLTPKDG